MEEQVAERMIIRATPGQCFDILTDFERYPEWAADIKAVTVADQDDRGRPTRVAFRAAAFGRCCCPRQYCRSASADCR